MLSFSRCLGWGSESWLCVLSTGAMVLPIHRLLSDCCLIYEDSVALDALVEVRALSCLFSPSDEISSVLTLGKTRDTGKDW